MGQIIYLLDFQKKTWDATGKRGGGWEKGTLELLAKIHTKNKAVSKFTGS